MECGWGSESGVVSDSSADCIPDSGCWQEEVEEEEGAVVTGWEEEGVEVMDAGLGLP